MNNKKRIKIRQPNHVSTANFKLTALQKNIIYLVVDQLQKKMSSDLTEEYEENKVIIKYKSLDKNKNYSRIRKAVTSLMSKPVEFDLLIPGEDKIQKNLTSLVSGFKYESNSDYISFIVPSQACIFFTYIGGGYTAFQKTIALSLRSIFSKYFYELCCRWADRGGYTCSIVKLKEDFQIQHKYNQISHLRAKVLDKAKQELKEKADFYFTYSLIKNSKSYNEIKIKIHQNKVFINTINKKLMINPKHELYVYNFINRFFPDYEDDRCLNYLNKIIDNNTLHLAYRRFLKLEKELEENKKSIWDVKNLLIVKILPELSKD